MPIFQSLEGVIKGADLCFASQLIRPGLILIYSAIDNLASVERTAKEGVGAGFQRWVKQYLPPIGDPTCKPVDIYGARCGVVHQLSADSDLSNAGKARRVVYAWGTGTAAELRNALDHQGYKDDIALHVNDLVAALRTAVSTYEKDLASDTVRQQSAEKVVKDTWLADLPATDVRTFLDIKGTVKH